MLSAIRSRTRREQPYKRLKICISVSAMMGSPTMLQYVARVFFCSGNRDWNDAGGDLAFHEELHLAMHALDKVPGSNGISALLRLNRTARKLREASPRPSCYKVG